MLISNFLPKFSNSPFCFCLELTWGAVVCCFFVIRMSEILVKSGLLLALVTALPVCLTKSKPLVTDYAKLIVKVK